MFRGLTQPHLLDWDRDGNTDLLVVYPGSYVYSGPLWVSRGPPAGKHEFKVQRVDVLRKDDGIVDLSIEDLDKDGAFDLTVAWSRYDEKAKVQDYGIGWLQNTTTSGEPVFADEERLISLPKPWRLIAFALVDWDTDGDVDVVLSVSKGSRKDGYVRQLWLYKKKKGIIGCGGRPAAEPKRSLGETRHPALRHPQPNGGIDAAHDNTSRGQ